MLAWPCRSVAIAATLPAMWGLAAIPSPTNRAIEIESPVDFQVFQRQTKAFGSIAVRGRAFVKYDRAETRVIGTSEFGELPVTWRALAADTASGLLHADLRVPSGGWYRVELRVLENEKPVATI